MPSHAGLGGDHGQRPTGLTLHSCERGSGHPRGDHRVRGDCPSRGPGVGHPLCCQPASGFTPGAAAVSVTGVQAGTGHTAARQRSVSRQSPRMLLSACWRPQRPSLLLLQATRHHRPRSRQRCGHHLHLPARMGSTVGNAAVTAAGTTGASSLMVLPSPLRSASSAFRPLQRPVATRTPGYHGFGHHLNHGCIHPGHSPARCGHGHGRWRSGRSGFTPGTARWRSLPTSGLRFTPSPAGVVVTALSPAAGFTPSTAQWPSQAFRALLGSSRPLPPPQWLLRHTGAPSPRAERHFGAVSVAGATPSDQVVTNAARPVAVAGVQATATRVATQLPTPRLPRSRSPPPRWPSLAPSASHAAPSVVAAGPGPKVAPSPTSAAISIAASTVAGQVQVAASVATPSAVGFAVLRISVQSPRWLRSRHRTSSRCFSSIAAVAGLALVSVVASPSPARPLLGGQSSRARH